MFAPEEQQIEICLLKSNLQEIENELIVQRMAQPELDAENEKKFRETMSVLKVVRTLNSEVEKLKQENMQLTAERMQLKRQSDELSDEMDNIVQTREKLTECLRQEQGEIDALISKYEDSLQEKADRFRNTRGYYNEEEINTEIDKLNGVIAELKVAMEAKQSEVDELSVRMDSIHPLMPENFLEEIGKSQMEERVLLLTKEHESLLEKQKKYTRLNNESNILRC